MRWIITTILTYLYGIVGTTIAAAAAMIVALLGDTSGRFWWPISRYWSYGLMKAAGISKVHTEGIENITENISGGVLMSNHESHLDPPHIYISFKKLSLTFFGKAYIVLFSNFWSEPLGDGAYIY